MAPLQHHFELVGWTETTITIRFWSSPASASESASRRYSPAAGCSPGPLQAF